MEKKKGQKTGSFEGVIMVRGKGIGFVAIPNEEEDIMIPNDALGTAFDGDIVRFVRTTESVRGRKTGRVTEVLERANTSFVGTVVMERGTAQFRPDNRRIHTLFTLEGASNHAVGMKVVVDVDSWGADGEKPTATISEVLGKAGDHETEMQAIIRGGGFAVDFPADVAKAAEELHNNRAKIFEEETNNPMRRDMRKAATCTIDPKNAKDFDDALSITDNGDGTYEIGVHIADVSQYVVENGPIDKEAQERGTSIYLVDRVIPMLPEVLSNDLCSLRPHEDRLAFSAVFTMNKDGGVVSSWYGKTLIHSDNRFTYESAQEVLDKGEGILHDELRIMMDLSRILRKARHADGAIAFDQPEVVFELDETGKPIDVRLKTRTETMLMIEDFMLLANQSVAEYINSLAKKTGKDMAFVYRIHDVPKAEKIEELGIFLRALGYDFNHKPGLVTAKNINTLLKDIAGSPEENLIKTATIRSMAKAVYSTKNIGHFGLAFKYYTHFTSPIRRYPDLMSHRLLLRHLNHSPISAPERTKYERLSIQSSERELNAVDAERTSIKFKQVEFMQSKVGQEFNGIITGVADWGIYVEERTTRAEGLVRLASLKKDFFEHEPGQYRVKGKQTGTSYRLGDEVRIKLIRANLDDRQLDFELVVKARNKD